MAGALESFVTALGFGRPLLLLRHAARGPIDDELGGRDVPLTAHGQKTARTLGHAVAEAALGAADEHGPSRDRAFVLGHSPLLRCRQTATGLARGIRAAGGTARVGGGIEHLAGVYLRRPIDALALSTELGGRFVRAWFDGELPAQLIAGRAAAARAQLQGVLGAMGDGPRRFGLFVSHDWNLMAVREQYFGIRHEDAGWLEFLDGVAIVPRDTELVLTYHAEVTRVPLTEALAGESS
jgi:broad specificity phosphatase PhoE